MGSRIVFALTLALALGSGACRTHPSRLVYSSGFSFANYDFLVVGRPDGESTNTMLYGMDIEFGNLMSRYNMKVIGDKEYEKLPLAQQKRTLFVRMSLAITGNNILMAVSFDDAVSGRTGSTITSHSKGNIFDPRHRTKAFEVLARTITRALVSEKHLTVANEGR